MNSLEGAALRAWQNWGHAWMFFGRCTGCGEAKQVRGPSKRRVLCLDCFDQR